MSMTYKQQPEAVMAFLEQTYHSISMLTNQLAQQLCEHASYRYLPSIAKFGISAHESLPEKILVTQDGDDEIIKDAQTYRAFTSFKAEIDQSTRLVERFPGVIAIPKDQQQPIQALIEEINNQKQTFAEFVRSSFKNRQTAHQVLHDLLPNLMYQQLIRPIYLLEQDLSIYFYWSIRPIVRRLNKIDAIKELEESRKTRQFELEQLDENQLEQRINHEIDLIARLHSKQCIVERRIARVQPYYDCYQAKLGTGKNKKIACRNASLPIIVFGEVHLASPLISYNAKQQQASKMPNSQYIEPLIARKHWYVSDNN